MLITQDMILTADEVAKLCQTLESAKDLAIHRQNKPNHIRDNYLIKVLLETGLRVFELTKLKVGDFRNKTIIVQIGKFGKKREVVLTNHAQKLLKDWLKIKSNIFDEGIDEQDYLFLSNWRKPFTTTGVRNRVKYWFSVCGLKSSFSCHTCRHTYVSHALASGLDLVRVKQNVGHSSLSTTSIYAHTVNNDLGDIDIYKKSFGNNGRRNFSGKN